MDLNENTPRKYPMRSRVKVKYFEESLDSTPRQKCADTTCSSIENEQGNYITDVIDDSMEEEALSDYEKLRLKNLEENRRMMLELGLIDPNQPSPKRPKIEKKHRPKFSRVKTKIKPSGPLKRSLRLLQRTPEGAKLSAISFDSTFEDTPEIPVVEELQRIEEEVLPMNKDGQSMDMLVRLKQSLSCESSISSVKSAENQDLINDLKSLKFAKLFKLTSSRIQGLSVHPNQSKLLVHGGSTRGEVAIYNVTDGVVNHFHPHKRAVNCISVDNYDPLKLLTTSHDGTIRQADINKEIFKMVYQTDEDSNMCHLTWHSQVDSNTLLVAHGTGQVGLIDMRAKQAQALFQCHTRSVRTTHLHPTNPQYFLTSSGTGECKIWDIRMVKSKTTLEPLSELFPQERGKGLTSAFFSPDGTKVVSTCNDDSLTIHDATDLANPEKLHRVLHNNHTGRWLTVFKAVWHPTSSDIIFVGSLIPSPRRIQMYNSSLRLVKELMDIEVTTVSSVIALHPKLPVVVGGNSTGKVHIFTNSTLASSFSRDDI